MGNVIMCGYVGPGLPAGKSFKTLCEEIRLCCQVPTREAPSTQAIFANQSPSIWRGLSENPPKEGVLSGSLSVLAPSLVERNVWR